MDRAETVERLEAVIRFLEARMDMANLDGKMVLGAWAKAVRDARDALTSDRVDVVRCRDCKRFWHNVGAKESGMLCYKCPPGREDEYYCADGERVEEDDGK